ncbi:MAG: hypothetical protein Q8R36_00605 [bacterium]|nr:hypothetical protein [bacterium]
MESLISFISQHWIALATTGGLVVVGVWAWPLLGAYEGSYQQGNRLAGRVLKTFSNDWKKEFDAETHLPLEERLQNIQRRVFESSCGQVAREYEGQLKKQETKLAEICAEHKQKRSLLTNEVNICRTGLEKEMMLLEQSLKIKTNELIETRRRADSEHMEHIRVLHATDHKKDSLFAGYVRSMRATLSSISGRVDKNITLYGWLLVGIALFLGDYYITFSIFNDLLKIATLPRFTVYIFSGVAALVFVALLELGIDHLENLKKKYAALVAQITWWAIGFLCLLLAVAYLLIIVVPVFQGREAQVIDALLRILFVPLMVGVALIIHRIRSLGGEVSRLIVDPFGALALVILIPCSWVVSILESIGLSISYGWRRYARSQRQLGPIELALAREIQMIQGQMQTKHKEQVRKLSLYESSLLRFEKQVSALENKLHKEIKTLQDKILQLKRGSNNAVVTNLRSA